MRISNSTNVVLGKFGSLLRALEATGNWRALLLTAGSFAAATIVMTIGGAIFAKTYWGWIIVLFTILAVLVGSIGISATGYIMMDSAKGITARSVGDALLSSIFSINRLYLSMLVLVLGFFAWVVLLVIVLFICKIPEIGPILYTVVFPLSVVISGMLSVFMFFAGVGVVSPSVWDGGTVMETTARMWTVAKQRFVILAMQSILVLLLVLVVSALIIVVFAAGASVTASLSAFTIATQISPMDLMGGLGSLMIGNTYGLSNGTGYVLAMLVGGGILWLIFLAIQVNITLFGNCIIYLELMDGLDIGDAQKKIQSGLDEAKRRAEEAKARAEELQRQNAITHSSKNHISSDDSLSMCPACGEVSAPEDAFCGNCGHGLR